MFVSALRIAIAKTSAAEERCALENALLKAESLDKIESEFETKINASKASRGESPTKLSKSKRRQLDDLSNDAAALQMQELVEFEEASSAAEILAVLKAGLLSDLQFWSGAAKYTHPADLPVVQEFVDAKRDLLEALNTCLKSRSSGAA